MLKTLKPFQKIGADFLAARYHALLADEPGLGKTVQAIAAAEQLGLKRMLVVCPASVRLGWRQELDECLGVKRAQKWGIVSYNGAKNFTWPFPGNVDGEAALDGIILDEVHFLKTPDSQRTQAIFGNGGGLARRARYKWALSGTPILNRPRELYPLLKTLASENIAPYNTFASYTQRYCGAYFDGRGLNTKGATHLDELARRLQGFMLRRTKAEVLPELPPKIITRVPLSVSEVDLAPIFAEEDLIANREAKLSSIHEDFSQLGDLARLLRLTGEAKVNATGAFIEDLLETTEKVVVFARHREVIKQLEIRFTERGFAPVVYHGGMSDAQKKAAVDVFKERPEVRVFIGQIQAAGTGINGLQDHCSTVVFAELSWVPGETGQAVDRCHRIGQTANSVNVYLLHVPGTLESAVLNVHDGKEKVIDRLMGVPDVLGDLV